MFCVILHVPVFNSSQLCASLVTIQQKVVDWQQGHIMVYRCLYILLGLGQFCSYSSNEWISKDFSWAVLICCNNASRPDFLLFAVIWNSIFFSSGSDDQPMLTQWNHISNPKKTTFRMLLEPQCTGSIRSSQHPMCLEINFSLVSY